MRKFEDIMNEMQEIADDYLEVSNGLACPRYSIVSIWVRRYGAFTQRESEIVDYMYYEKGILGN